MPQAPRPTVAAVQTCFIGNGAVCDPSIGPRSYDDLGFAFAGGDGWSVQPTQSGDVRNFGAGQCWDGICQGGYIQVAVSSVKDGIALPASPEPSGEPAHTIKGTTLDALAHSWAAVFADTPPEPTID